MSEDSDLLVYRCPLTLFKLDEKAAAGTLVRYDDLRACEDASGAAGRHLFDAEGGEDADGAWAAWDEGGRFVDLCILAGTDYLDALSGVGIKGAHAALRRHGTLERALRHPPFKTPLPTRDDERAYLAQVERVRDVYRHALVYDARADRVLPLTPLPPGRTLPKHVGVPLPPELARAVCADATVDANSMRGPRPCDPSMTDRTREVIDALLEGEAARSKRATTPQDLADLEALAAHARAFAPLPPPAREQGEARKREEGAPSSTAVLPISVDNDGDDEADDDDDDEANEDEEAMLMAEEQARAARKAALARCHVVQLAAHESEFDLLRAALENGPRRDDERAAAGVTPPLEQQRMRVHLLAARLSEWLLPRTRAVTGGASATATGKRGRTAATAKCGGGGGGGGSADVQAALHPALALLSALDATGEGRLAVVDEGKGASDAAAAAYRESRLCCWRQALLEPLRGADYDWESFAARAPALPHDVALALGPELDQLCTGGPAAGCARARPRASPPSARARATPLTRAARWSGGRTATWRATRPTRSARR